MDHGARVDYIITGKLGRGGAINLIAPNDIASKNCLGEATSGYLLDVQKVTWAEMEEWKKNILKHLKENTTRVPDYVSTPGLSKKEVTRNGQGFRYRCFNL